MSSCTSITLKLISHRFSSSGGASEGNPTTWHIICCWNCSGLAEVPMLRFYRCRVGIQGSNESICVVGMDKAMSKTKALDPQKMAKPFLLVWVWILTMCVENVYHRFPSMVFIGWRLIPHRSSSYQEELNLPPCSTVCIKPSFIVPLHVIIRHPCSAVYKKHPGFLGCWGISTWDSRWHSPSSCLPKPTPLSLCACVCVLSSFSYLTSYAL